MTNHERAVAQVFADTQTLEGGEAHCPPKPIKRTCLPEPQEKHKSGRG